MAVVKCYSLSHNPPRIPTCSPPPPGPHAGALPTCSDPLYTPYTTPPPARPPPSMIHAGALLTQVERRQQAAEVHRHPLEGLRLWNALHHLAAHHKHKTKDKVDGAHRHLRQHSTARHSTAKGGVVAVQHNGIEADGSATHSLPTDAAHRRHVRVSMGVGEGWGQWGRDAPRRLSGTAHHAQGS